MQEKSEVLLVKKVLGQWFDAAHEKQSGTRVALQYSLRVMWRAVKAWQTVVCRNKVQREFLRQKLVTKYFALML